MQISMRVAHYYPWVYLTSGIERVILEICKRSKHHNTIFTNHFDRENTYPEFRDLEVVQLRDVSVRRTISYALRAALTIAFQKVPFDQFDALVVHCDGLGDLILYNKPLVPAICFCHTPLRPVFDAEYRKNVLQRYSLFKGFGFHVFSSAFKIVDRKMWDRYRYVFFNSAETAERAKSGGLLRGNDGNHEILHPGIDWHNQTPSWKYEPYFLLPGRIMWTKNIETALQGFIIFKNNYSQYSHFRLIITGRVDEKSQKYLADLQKLSAGRDDIEFIISPSDAKLWSLYANCYSVLFPAFNEDWGIVPLEGNTYGKPVIATNMGGPTESQVDGQTGYLVPNKPEAFASAMAKLCNDIYLVRRMGGAGRTNASRFDWSSFVKRFDTVVEEVAPNRN